MRSRKLLSTLLIALTLVLWAQVAWTGPTLVTSASTEWINVSGGDTTATPVDTTGANFIVVGITSSNAASIDATAVTDSKGNTYTLLIGPITSGDSVGIYYSQNPTVGTGHTFTIATEANDFGVMTVGAFSGMLTSGITDQSSSATDGGTPGTTASAGSITTTVANTLVIAVAAFGGGIDITFTGQESFANNPGVSGTVASRGNLSDTASGWMGYSIRTSIGTESGNTVTQSGTAAVWAGAQADFKASATDSAVTPSRMLRGVGQ